MSNNISNTINNNDENLKTYETELSQLKNMTKKKHACKFKFKKLILCMDF